MLVKHLGDEFWMDHLDGSAEYVSSLAVRSIGGISIATFKWQDKEKE